MAGQFCRECAPSRHNPMAKARRSCAEIVFRQMMRLLIGPRLQAIFHPSQKIVSLLQLSNGDHRQAAAGGQVSSTRKILRSRKAGSRPP
jgi:hypothetical protein